MNHLTSYNLFESLKPIKLNGFGYLVDWDNRIIYENEKDKVGTSFKHLTASEIEIIRNQIYYDKPMITESKYDDIKKICFKLDNKDFYNTLYFKCKKYGYDINNDYIKEYKTAKYV